MSQELVTQNTDAQNLAIFSTPDAMDVIQDVIRSDDFSAADLDRVRVPGAGGLMWEIPTAEGSRNESELNGIIIYHQTGRGYWPSQYNGDNSPPKCASMDGVCGHGEPGGDCSVCPFNQYESAESGAGKACKETRTLLLLQENELIPTVLRIPPSSLKDFKAYLLRLAKGARRIQHVVTCMTLERDKSKGGITYSRIKFKTVLSLNPEERARVSAFAAAFAETFKSVHAESVVEGEASQAQSREDSEENPFN